MAEGRLLLAVAVLLVVVAMAGCVSSPSHDGQVNAVSPSPPSPDEPAPDYTPNLWLLDAPHPSSTRVSGGAEPFILADRDGEYLWIGDTTGGYYSTDNGTTWTKMGTYTGNVGVAFRDGWVFAEDESGRLYAAVLHDNRVDVIRSGDNGKTWNQVTYAAGVSGTADRPWIAAQGNDVAMVYFDAPAVATGVFEHCARSTNSGTSFTDRNPIAGSPQGGNLVYDDEGNFYYGDNDGRVYKFAGTCLTPTSRNMFSASLGAYNNMVPVAVEGDELCMAIATSSNNAIQVGCMRDFGTPKVRTISPDFLPSNIFATISMHNGEIAVAWYGSETEGDIRAEGFDGAFNVYVARITGFWEDEPVIQYQRITEEPNHVGQICIGGISCTESSDRDLLDYFGIDHDIWGGVHVAYGHDGDGSTAQVRYAFVPAGEIGDNGTVIDPDAPIAGFRHHVVAYDVEVDASDSFDPLGQALTYAWDWGDGTTGEGQEASHTYEEFGAYHVTLTVTTEDGRLGEAGANLIIDGSTSNAGPEAKFAVSPSVPEAGQAVRFKDRSTDDGEIVSRVWRFGDGLASQAAEPKHTYELPGNYTVSLEVTDDQGASDSFTGVLEVVPVGQGVSDPQDDDSFIEKTTPGMPLGVLLALLVVVLAARRRVP